MGWVMYGCQVKNEMVNTGDEGLRREGKGELRREGKGELER